MNSNSVFVIAELSANHGGKIDIAKETVRAAKRAGADAIKLQTYTADTITLDAKNDDFKIEGTIWEGKFLYDLYKEAFLPWEWHEELFNTATEEGLVCFSSPFDATAVDFLEELNNPIYKIASFEITDIPLIKYVASKGKPIIISTGIARYDDIALAIGTCRAADNNDITLLKCTSSYPAPIEKANLSLMQKFSEDFGVKIGLSDHTLGATLPIVAVAMGARVIEKHFILDKSIGGPDASFSMDEKEFGEMVTSIRAAESALGIASYDLTAEQEKSRQFMRSLYATEDINIGDKLTNKNIRSVRPGYGLAPRYYSQIVNKDSAIALKKGDRIPENIIGEELE